MRGLRRWVVITMVALQSLLGSAPLLAQDYGRAVDESGEARDQISLTFVAEAVGLYTAHLSFTATPILDAPSLDVSWRVEAAQMIDGPATETLGAVAAN